LCQMSEPESVVYIIDDDASMREDVADLLRTVGLQVQSFGSTQEFLNFAHPDVPGCILLDMRLPGPSGLETQRILADLDVQLPIIFVSGYADVPTTVRALKSGAIEFLTKPLHHQQLLDAVYAAIERDRKRREEAKALAELRQRFETLTPREREVLSFVVAGQANKQIAAHLGLSEITVNIHRRQVMSKMQARSVVDLVRMTDKLEASTGKK
jgi:FixJ family two-component response regulator